MRRVRIKVPIAEAKLRALRYLCSRHRLDLAAAARVADAIWTDQPFLTGQGAGAAASRILKLLEKDGHAEWVFTGSNWGYRATPLGRCEERKQ
jgi:hypothetical protein